MDKAERRCYIMKRGGGIMKGGDQKWRNCLAGKTRSNLFAEFEMRGYAGLLQGIIPGRQGLKKFPVASRNSAAS
jgi:hypothetical protein